MKKLRLSRRGAGILRELAGAALFLLSALATRWAFGFEWAVLLGLTAIYAKACAAAPRRGGVMAMNVLQQVGETPESFIPLSKRKPLPSVSVNPATTAVLQEQERQMARVLRGRSLPKPPQAP